MLDGFLNLPWWGLVLVTLMLTHFTIVSVTLFLHRAQAHRALDLHPAVSHVFRFWLWLTTGMVTREWVAVHRKHHAKCETPDDPHSPWVEGINKVMWAGAELYRDEADNPNTIQDYSHGMPEDDWLERHVYSRHRYLGVALMLIIDVLAFGAIGLTIWAIQMAWIPFWAAGVINGAGHYWGYRNFEPQDGSTNLVAWGIVVGGEELHNNHHAFPASAKFSVRPFEFDVGWFYIQILSLFGLASVRRVAPTLKQGKSKKVIDMETVKAVVTAKLHVSADYAQTVLRPVWQDALKNADAAKRQLLTEVRESLIREDSLLDYKALKKLNTALDASSTLKTVYEYHQQLQDVWNQRYSNSEKLLAALQEWCNRAEATGIRALEEFSKNLRGYELARLA